MVYSEMIYLSEDGHPSRH